MDSDEQEKKAFDFAGDTTKQLITLTSAIIALTITFAKDIFGVVPLFSKILLMLAWVIYIFSLLFGIAALGTLTAWIAPDNPKELSPPPSSQTSISLPAPDMKGIWGGSVKFTAGGQMILFFVGTLFVVVCGLGFAFGEVARYRGSNQVQAMRPLITKALTTPNLQQINMLLPEDGRFTTVSGLGFTKSQLVSEISSSNLVFDYIQTEPFKTDVFEETATQTGYVRAAGRYAGRNFAGTFHYTVIYVKRDNGWKAVTFQLANLQ